MLIKQVQRAVVAAWSPGGNQIIGGSAAQQLDATFNTSASLEIFDLGLAQPDATLNPVASIPSENRFHKIVWGNNNKTNDAGIIVGGCDDGVLQIYSAPKLLESKESALLAKPDKHTGAVRALDINPYQTNLLATGATQSEIYIWDLNNTGTPMTPGTKSQPLENVQWISWNRQVQHILASAFSSRCVVWDLRKNEPIIKLTDSNGRVSWRVVSWHPDVATQLCLASEDDLAPVIQLWDLRFATAPLKVLENHTRGILSIAWCQQDPDLLISCGKDCRILCWNPNSQTPGGEVLSELARTPQWNFDVTWCPKNPALISACSSDGLLSIYSLMGGPSQAQLQNTQQQASQILADSFPGMGDYMNAPIQQQNYTPEPSHTDLAKPPKWLKKPVGAKFAFGGKLVSFANEKQPLEKIVYVSQVVSEPKLIEQSNELENAIKMGNFVEYCQIKGDATNSQHRRYVWYFLKSYFEPNPRSELLDLLGYKQEDVCSKLAQRVNKSQHNGEINNLTNQMASLNRGISPGLDGSGVFDAIAANSTHDEKEQIPFDINISNDSEGLITQALLTGNIELAVELCFENGNVADGLALATIGGPALVAMAQKLYLKQAAEASLTPIIKALIRDDWNPVIEHCKPNSWREALVAVLTHTTHHQLPYLVQKLGERLETKEKDDAVLCYICAGSISNLVQAWWEPDFSNEQLQELIEVVVILQKAIEAQGRKAEISGTHAKLLNQYALLLAAEGNLNPALSYLGNASQDPQINDLRERLYCAIGHKQPYSTVASNQQRQRNNSYYQPPQPQRTPSVPTIPPVYNNPIPPIPQQPSWMQQNTLAPQLSNPQVTSYGQPNPTPPPRPPSVSSTQGSSGLPKSKYVLDPSVQPSYGSMPSYQPVMTSQPLANPYSSVQSTPYNQPSYNNSMMSPMPPVNPLPQALPPQIPSMSSSILNPSVSQFNSNNQSSLPYPSNPQTQGGIPSYSNQQQNFYNLSASTAPKQIPTTPLPPSATNVLPPQSTPGWNDPPPLTKSLKQPKSEPLPPPNAITHPLFNPGSVAAEQNIVEHVPMMPPPMNVMNPAMNNQVPAYNFNVGSFPQQQLQQQKPQQYAPVAKQALEPEKPKGPIPEEHMHLKTVFDQLQSQCSQSANNPQIKRKLDDVKRKLETLYDLLRENKLSPNTLSVLHQMIQVIQNGDYNGALNAHTQLVSGPDFASIASFMPGLKMLLQCAQQLQVYLR